MEMQDREGEGESRGEEGKDSTGEEGWERLEEGGREDGQ